PGRASVFRMMPKDEGFYDFFERAAANVHESAMLLENFMRDFTEVQERARQFHNREHKGDQFTREVIDKLNRTFITPFDREDIHRLVGSMDDGLDKMDEAVNRMVLYKVTAIYDEAKQLGSILVHATELIRDMMPALRTLKEPQLILNNCLEIRHQEA